MYIPSLNQMPDQVEQINFMRSFNFATIVSIHENTPIATPLPFLIIDSGSSLKLQAHFAKNNEQWERIITNNNLVIFSQPHAYISPAHYEKEQNVPTWNYIAVHAYGECRLITDDLEIDTHLSNLIMDHEPGYRSQWDALPDAYKRNLKNGIVAFEIEVTRIDAKKKLSQNRTETERQNIIKHLKDSTDTNERQIANYMQALKTE